MSISCWYVGTFEVGKANKIDKNEVKRGIHSMKEYGQLRHRFRNHDFGPFRHDFGPFHAPLSQVYTRARAVKCARYLVLVLIGC